ncbi:MAG TPA: menaquinone biosynthesis protein [Longimicrobiales bacterium]|nr:menaquinone biosynthesis protein [Longimicrobiales bacterium]
MVRLGHIEYSNCIPVHARLLEPGAPAWLEVRTGVPSELNGALARGEIDVAPCSSIEYARHAAVYRLLPEFAIASHGAVQSIRFETRVPVEALAGALIALPTASATSVVLLRILLAHHWGVPARFCSFDQAREDPFAADVRGALWIGDFALRRCVPDAHHVYDLGAEWLAWSGLPFAFAVWQVRRELAPADVQRLRVQLRDSRSWFLQHEAELAARYATRFGITAERLRQYWSSLVYDLDDEVRRGLLRFLSEAAALGEAPPVAALAFVSDAG